MRASPSPLGRRGAARWPKPPRGGRRPAETESCSWRWPCQPLGIEIMLLLAIASPPSPSRIYTQLKITAIVPICSEIDFSWSWRSAVMMDVPVCAAQLSCFMQHFSSVFLLLFGITCAKRSWDCILGPCTRHSPARTRKGYVSQRYKFYIAGYLEIRISHKSYRNLTLISLIL